MNVTCNCEYSISSAKGDAGSFSIAEVVLSGAVTLVVGFAGLFLKKISDGFTKLLSQEKVDAECQYDQEDLSAATHEPYSQIALRSTTPDVVETSQEGVFTSHITELVGDSTV